MKYFLSGLFLALFVSAGVLGLVSNTVKARETSIPTEHRPCTWSELKLCYAGVANGCCPGAKGDG